MREGGRTGRRRTQRARVRGHSVFTPGCLRESKQRRVRGVDGEKNECGGACMSRRTGVSHASEAAGRPVYSISVNLCICHLLRLSFLFYHINNLPMLLYISLQPSRLHLTTRCSCCQKKFLGRCSLGFSQLLEGLDGTHRLGPT